MSELSKAWRKQVQIAVTAFLLAAADGARVAGQLQITAIDPPEKDFFSKRLDFNGIPIKAHKVVVDEALYAAYDRLALLFSDLLTKQPMVISNLVAAGAELHIMGRIVIGKAEPHRRRPNARTGTASRPQTNPLQR